MAGFVGYARVSTKEQKTDIQLDALRKAGCRRVFQDKISGKRTSRKGLDAALADLRPGEKLAVWRIDRLGRSIVHILTTVDDLAKRGSALVSLTEHCDTSDDSGRTQCIFLAVMAELEHGNIIKRTRAGVAAEAARGRKRGGKPKLTPAQIAEAARLLKKPGTTAASVAARYAVGRATLFRHLGHTRSSGQTG